MTHYTSSSSVTSTVALTIAGAVLGAPAAHADNMRLNNGVVSNVYTIQHQAGCTNNVVVNKQLQLAAQWHTRDVLNNPSLGGDIGSDGSTAQQRADAAGFKGLVAETVAINPALAITITESGVATTTIAAGTNPTITNKAGRTLQGFATTSTVTSKMYSGCAGCPYQTFMQFYNYYGDLDYADKWVLAALDATALTYTNGMVADFSSTTGANVYTRVDAVKKGTAYMNTWMYVIREFEDAIDDCTTSSIDNNYDAAHAWDEGVAFWTGSLEGKDGYSSGKQIYALAEKRCKNYKTCGPNGGLDTLDSDGDGGQDTTAKVNFDLFYWFANAQYLLVNGRCDAEAGSRLCRS